ncbi:hypothetical protein C8K38_111197 [Rhodococcus sp. OK611]|uniref:hypothetical protein n=1 Tax=unclassified Rhodococcus (in: high G+C Gram-positive bacteria) TaxID=192944 RepID=UPI000BC58A16|nr:MULTISPECIES: hypothetical protein [unclassified Rhodococcus (in: high G+C Gram-positive bacteria)]PTR42028.1 hypothetical protein C8K38_111197 [Rhodococcus sp. OK611]SNX91525.1 hypothetical protein SAMN05447004_11060 [Rhodococcus sp. OK270]
MPADDDFDSFDDTDTDSPETAPEVEPNRAARRKKGRKGKAVIPTNAPEPQDHLAKQAARVAEAPGTATIVLTLWDEEIRIEQSELLNSWDWQVGAIQKNLLMMVKGLLGDRRFLWFTTRAQADGKTPIEAASEVMELFSKATGLGSAGK